MVFVAKEKRTSVYFDRDKSQFANVDEALIGRLKDMYPGINVSLELKKMCLWLLSPKGLKSKGTINFITNWLGNAPVTKTTEPEIELDTPLRPELNAYLKELWKGKEYLLTINKRKN